MSGAQQVTIWYNDTELDALRGLGMRIGKNVKLSRFAQLASNDIVIGDGSQIDGFTQLAGKIRIGRHCHVSHGALLLGEYGITLGDFAGVSPYSVILTATEHLDGLGGGPASLPQFRKTVAGPVAIGMNATVFAHCTVLPGAVMEEGAILGAHSLLRGRVPAGEVWGGVPAKKIRDRSIEADQRLDEALAIIGSGE